MKDNVLVWFSPISILLGLAISILQLYVTSKQAKLKEIIIDLLRKEMAEDIEAAKSAVLKEVDYKIQISEGKILNSLNHRPR